MNYSRQNLQGILLLAVFMFFCIGLNAQISKDSVKIRSLYRPPVSLNQDTLPVPDSVQLREQYIYDSIQVRLAFIKDSIAIREKFVRDSIARRERILDSLNFLKAELPRLFEAAIKSTKEEIIIDSKKLYIIGDSTLSNFTYVLLPFNLSQPFTPWKATINLSDKPVKLGFDAINKKITSVQAPALNCEFIYGKQKNILKINEKGTILSKSTGNLYKEPFDTVFFDALGRIAKVKRYNYFHQVVNNYQKGVPLFVHLSQVKQYEYNSHGRIVKYQVVNFCDRWSGKDENKICNIISYTFDIQGKKYKITRQNDPVNNYSDGIFTIEFDEKDNLKSLSFINTGKSENWKTHVEVNELGNVSRYLYEINGKISQTLDFNYYLDDLRAKYPVEIIKCSFEDDGISYFQTNTTTGLSRSRNRTTGEWGPWR